MPLELNAAAFAASKQEGRRLELSIAGLKPMLAMPVHYDIPPLTVQSLLETQQTLINRGTGFEIVIAAGNSLVHHSRSKLAWRFLQSDCNRLFWIDSDIEWRARQLLRLLALSTRMPIVCAAYPAKNETEQFMLHAVGENQTDVEANEYGCLEMGGLGLGFACIDRAVIEALSKKAEPVKFPDELEPIPYIFRCDTEGGAARGEDMAFFADCRAAGYRVWLDPSIELGHIGSKTYRASLKKYLVASPEPTHAGTSDAA